MLYLDLEKFGNASACGTQIANDEIPVQAVLGLQFSAEEAIIRIADDILKEVFLLNLDELHLEIRLLDEVEIPIQGLEPQVDCLCLEVLHQPAFVGQQVLLVQFPVLAEEEFYRLTVRGDGVVREIGQLQRTSELLNH